ncbi:hypothetical protein [Corynebacterium tuscaniense]|uniref:hypothetical protein n=1 Tax=Corynebacterium tuscaniense TaxID=302449 RepID=UPI00123AEB03|nr:hypothetical protein [Corynebacterium tuscaniense]KAA8744655.1 hypothetical protein F4V54_02430 [Corynebacterium tuscaniense]
MSEFAKTFFSWKDDIVNNWGWSDPSFLVSFLSMLFAAVIPFVLWRMGARQSKTNMELLDKQAISLSRQERIVERQRRDSLMLALADTTNEAYLRVAWDEIREFPESDQKLLKSIIRTNPKISLPGSSRGLGLLDELDQDAVDDYCNGLGRRYGVRKETFAYRGLLDFLRLVSREKLNIDTSLIVELVTGEAAAVERPTHLFFTDLVLIYPPCAAELIYRAEGIDVQTAGGLKLNVLTGVFLAVKLVEKGDFEALRVSSKSRNDIKTEFVRSIPLALVYLMHRGGLQSVERWSYSDSSERVSATIAWLIFAIGNFADVYDHWASRMVENLEPAISSIPVEDRRWGVDAKDVREGFDQIRAKQPALWARFGDELEKAASAIGSWRS